jgi:hypothetical protein
MSITALYVFTPTAFTTSKSTVIEYLSKDPPGGSSPDGYSVMTKKVSGPFMLEPGVYRLKPGASITRGPAAVDAAISPTGGIAGAAASTAGFKFSPITSTKTDWPDPPANAASNALKIPMNILKAFLADAGEESVLAPASGTPDQQPNR